MPGAKAGSIKTEGIVEYGWLLIDATMGEMTSPVQVTK
jgi:hypothetical protein